MLSISPMMTVITDMYKHICAIVNLSSWPKTSSKLWSSSSIMSAVAKIWRDNKVLIVMGGILTMGHFVWRELQNNTAFVPAGMPSLKRKLVINFFVRSEKYGQFVSVYEKKLNNLLQDLKRNIPGLRLPSTWRQLKESLHLLRHHLKKNEKTFSWKETVPWLAAWVEPSLTEKITNTYFCREVSNWRMV